MGSNTNVGVELTVVVPVYNEEKGIAPFLARMRPVLDGCVSSWEIIFSLDPCRDRTEEVIRAEIEKDSRLKLLIMTRRWGQPAATIAGLEHAAGRAAVVIDVDLQDPPELIPDLVAKWREGYQVVYAQRRSRKGETWHHLLRAKLGYRLISAISEIPIPRDTGDFRLLDRKVVDALKTLPEIHGYLRGLVPYVGYRQTGVLFDRDPRSGGESQYGRWLGNMRINVNSLVGFSIFPLQVASLCGLAVLALGFLLLVVGAVWWAGYGRTPSTADFILLAVLGVGGLHLLCLGVVGEYIGRIYDEARRRPKYLVRDRVNFPPSPLAAGDHRGKP